MNYINRISWKWILLYTLPICFLYISTLLDAFQIKNAVFKTLQQSRSFYIIGVIIIGFLIGTKRRFNQLIISGLALSFYMFFMSIFIHSSNVDIVTITSTTIIWSFTLFITNNAILKKKDIQLISIIVGLTCNIMAIIWVSAKDIIFELESGIVAYNSIYYILATLPFIFLIKKKFVQIVLLPLPIYSFFLSQKSTCIIAVIFVFVYYFKSYFTVVKAKNKIWLICMFIISIYILGNLLNWSEIYKSFLDDIESGGNGRINVIGGVLSLLKQEPSIIKLLFGHGYDAVATYFGIGAHNDFIEILYNYGLFGLSFFIGFWFILIRNIKMFHKNSYERKCYIISLIIYFSVSMASKFINTQIHMIFFTTLWGILLYENNLKVSHVTLPQKSH